DFILEVKVLNPGQQETLFNAAVEILPYLRHQLQNSKIQMRVTVDESNEKHLAYTSTEKYNHLLAINPALGKLQSEFNLRTD
ncbi:MAG: DNA polymerase III subunit gamma/tau, partial [bacterium]|nr:DNA polymerase III subunit gamma/tau [bacterium]